MNLEEFRKKRKARLENLQEALSNMPELVDDKVHGEVGAVEMDAIKSSKERDEKVKDSFKDKNKEVKEFVKKQDKDRKVDKEEESENRLLLDESLFDESLNEEMDDTDPNDWKTMEIISEAMFDENGEYTHSNLYVGHDGGRGLKSIQEYNQIPEITDLSVGDLFADYINEHL